MMLLTDEEMGLLEWESATLDMSFVDDYRNEVYKKVVEHIEKYVFYMDTRGYIALKPNATTNWQAILKEVK